MAAIRRTNQTHITGKLDALDADAPDAFYQLPESAPIELSEKVQFDSLL